MEKIYINGLGVLLSHSLVTCVNESIFQYKVEIKANMHIFSDSSILPQAFYKIYDKIPLSKDELYQINNIKDDPGKNTKVTSDEKVYILSDRIVSLLKNPNDYVINAHSTIFDQMLNHISTPSHTFKGTLRFDFNRIFSCPDNYNHKKELLKVKDTGTAALNKKLVKYIKHKKHLKEKSTFSTHELYYTGSAGKFLAGLDAYLIDNPEITHHKAIYRRYTNTNIFKYYPHKEPNPYDDVYSIKWKITNKMIKAKQLSIINELILCHGAADDFTKNIKNLKIYFSDGIKVVNLINLSGKGIFMLNFFNNEFSETTKTPIRFL